MNHAAGGVDLGFRAHYFAEPLASLAAVVGTKLDRWLHEFWEVAVTKWRQVEKGQLTIRDGKSHLDDVTHNSGILVLNQIRRLRGSRNVNLSITQTSTLSLTPNTQKMKGRYSSLGLVRKSLIK